MAYEVIDEDLKVEACEVGDMPLSQIESFLRLWGDGEKIETLTVFSRQDGTIVLNKNHPGYKAFKDFTLSYLQLEDSEREKLDSPEGIIKEDIAVIDRVIEQRRAAAVLDILKHSRIDGVPYNTLQKIFKKYDCGLIGLCQIFAYGVIEGKRAERAKRKAKQCIEQEK